jgi:tetratricopeptide (TPR) repeat protein
VADKMTRKELKGPDAFQRTGQEAREWVQTRARTLTIAVVVGLLALGGVALGSYLSGRTESDASKDLGSDLKLLGRPVDATPGAEANADNPPFKTEREKDESIIKTLGEFRDKHRGTRAAASASLPMAQALYRLGRYDDALLAYDDYLHIASPDDSLRALAYEGRGYCYEAKKQLDQALAAFDQLSRENKTEFMNGMGLYHRARVLIEEGKKDEAAKQLAEIPGSAPNSAAARLAQDRMQLLASEGVIIPVVAKPAGDAG